MAIPLKSKPGITGATTLSIPKDWDSTWFRGFISNLLKGADVRNAVGINGITVTGTIASPYATISGGGAPMTIGPPPAAVTTLTINGAATTGYLPTVLITAPNTAGQSNGLTIRAGTNVNDAPFVLSNAANTFNYYALLGDSSWSYLRAAGQPTLTMSANGVMQLNIAGSGVGTFGIGVTPDSVFQVLAAGGLGGLRIAFNGTSNNFYDANQHNIRNGNGATQLVTIAAAGVTVGAPTGGAMGAGTINCTGLFVNGVAVTVP